MTSPRDADRRMFFIFWVSGEAYSSGHFEYRGQWGFRMFVKHSTSGLLLRRLQQAGIVFLSTNESSAMRQWRKTELGIEMDTGSKEPVVEREINGTVVFRFNRLIGAGAATFDIEYKGEVASSGSIDAKADIHKRMFRRLQKMGVLFFANSECRRLLDEYGYDLGIEFDEDPKKGRLF